MYIRKILKKEQIRPKSNYLSNFCVICLILLTTNSFGQTPFVDKGCVVSQSGYEYLLNPERGTKIYSKQDKIIAPGDGEIIKYNEQLSIAILSIDSFIFNIYPVVLDSLYLKDKFSKGDVIGELPDDQCILNVLLFNVNRTRMSLSECFSNLVFCDSQN